MAVEGTGSTSRTAPPRLADPQASSAPAQQRPAAAAQSEVGANEAQSAPLDPPVVVELSESAPRFAPVNTRDQVSLGPLTDSALSAEAAMQLASRTRDLLSSQTASLTNQPSQTILSLFPN